MSDLIFELSHLDGYAIIEEPSTIFVRNNSRLDFNLLYTEDGNPRWLLNLKALTRENLNLIRALAKEPETIWYTDVGHLLITGALWRDQIKAVEYLPVKGEEVIAVFDYVDEVLRCISVTAIPKISPERYSSSLDYMEQIEEFRELFNNIKDE